MTADFRETQGLPGWVAYVAIAIILLASVIVFAAAPAGSRGAPVLAVGFSIALVALLISRVRMHTALNDTALNIQAFWLVRRSFALSDIAAAAAIRYRPLRDYGGWGIPWSRQGTAYTMRGNAGVQLVLTGGKRVLIGSDRAETLAAAMHARGVAQL